MAIEKEVGVPVSAPIDGYVGGHRFSKVKVLVDLIKPLKDMVSLTYLVLGPLEILCV